MSTPIYLCGHIDGIDCGSGQQVTYDLVTLDKAVALAHAKKWAGSWITEGFYKEMPCAELAKVLSNLEAAQVEAASRKLDNEQLSADLAAARDRLRMAHDYIKTEWKLNRLYGGMNDALINSLNEPIDSARAGGAV